MKHLPLLLTALTILCPSAALADVAIVHGNAAFTAFDHTSADGCVHTVGELVLLEATEGAENADGVYLTGSQEDTCAGTGNGFASYVEADFTMIGLIYAHFAGSIVAESYSGGSPITFEVDLTWLGRGRTSRSHNVYDDNGALAFTIGAERTAVLRGTLFADGIAMPSTSAKLMRETRGTLSR